MKIGFIGAGKVGYSLGKLLSSSSVHVTGYYSQHIESAKEAAEFTGTYCYETKEELLSESDIIFLTVPDGQITPVYESLISYGIEGKIICHASGALSSYDAFPDIELHKAFGYSVHPLFPVSSKLESYRKLSDAYFCIEGHDKYLDDIKNIFASLGIRILTIDKADKVKYHCACAVASNLVCSLIDQSVNMLTECGFDSKDALDALAPLIRCNIDSVLEKGAMDALTGPVERCDVTTVQKHVKCLEERDDLQELNLYKAASRRLVRISEKRHPDRDYEEMKMLLE